MTEAQPRDVMTTWDGGVPGWAAALQGSKKAGLSVLSLGLVPRA